MPNLIPVGQIVTPTSKWQVTIPKKIREDVGLDKKTPLNVTSNNGKIMMLPIKRIVKEEVWTEEKRKKLLKEVKKIKGIWADDWPEIKKRLAKQRKTDLEEIKKLKKL